jgi:uncharacterized protein (TIGR00159 family)
MIAAAVPGMFSRFTGAVHAVNTRDLLTTTADVVIVFYVVYRILKLVRGTRAAQTMAGMALLGGLFFLAKKLDLYAVSWLFEKLIDYFIIFFVVIFQQDLRRALMQVGQNLFMRRQYEETYVIEEVVQATVELAKQRIGALIAIERDADLSEHIGEVGIELDARVTKELLITLFIPEPQNNMHDGAVIIRNLRIQQAGAVLPLSANAKLDKQFGTRHRAAIGITEETDAVVVVVSEERGAVSLCFNGNIARDLDAATLRKALLGLFQKKKNKGKGQPPAPRTRRSGELPTEGGAPLDAKSAVLKSSLGGAARAPGDNLAGEKLPSELIPLFTTQEMLRPRDPLDEPLEGPVGQPMEDSVTAPLSSIQQASAALAAKTAAVEPVMPGGDVTAPMMSVKAVYEAAKRADERSTAERNAERPGDTAPKSAVSAPKPAAVESAVGSKEAGTP